MRWKSDALAALLCVAAAGAGADARIDYMLHCMGCHLEDGTGLPPAVPALAERVGYYLEIPGGREYLVQVPGSANAPLSDAALAEVLNWIVERFGGASMPAEFSPYSADEVAKARADKPADVTEQRRALGEAVESLIVTRARGNVRAPCR